MEWMITYQDVRRNMCEAEKIYANDKVSARRIEEENEKKIKEGYSKERRSEKSSCVQMDAGSNVQQRDRSTYTREQRAKIAGVSAGTVARYDTVMNSNNEEQNQTVRKILSDTAGVSEDTYSKVKDIVLRKLNKVKN